MKLNLLVILMIKSIYTRIAIQINILQSINILSKHSLRINKTKNNIQEKRQFIVV